MPIGIREIGLTGTCRYCDQAIELRGIPGGSLGLSWDDDWRTRPEPGDQTTDTRLCRARMELAQARFRRPTGYHHQPHRASIRLRQAPGDPALKAEDIGLRRYAVMQKTPVSLFWPTGLLITGVPAGIGTWEVQAELEAAARGWFLLGAVGAFVANVEVGQRHEIVTDTGWSLAKVRENQVLAIDWERLVAAAQGRLALIRHDWRDLRTGGLTGLARKARTYRRARTDRRRRLAELNR